MFNIEKAHFIIDEMVMAGYIVETNKTNILNPVVTVVKASQQWLDWLIDSIDTGVIIRYNLCTREKLPNSHLLQKESKAKRAT